MPQHPLGWRGRRRWQRFKQKGEALWVLTKAGRLTERGEAEREENKRQKERCGNLLTQALCRRDHGGGRMLFVLRFERSPWLLIGVTSDNLKSLNAHMHNVTAHVLPISSCCTAVKMISGETEIAVHDYSVCTLISYTQTSCLFLKKGENSRVTHTRAANFFMLLQADKQVFPTQENWLHLCDQ